MRLPQAKRGEPGGYFRTVINNACRDELDKILRHRRRLESYDEKLDSLSELADHQTPATILNEKQAPQELMKVLTDEEKEIITLILGLYCAPLSIRKVAIRKRRTHATITRLYHGSLDKMRNRKH